MNYIDEVKSRIKEMRAEGSSSRTIAGFLGISKSGVNDFLQRERESYKGPKILLLDIETSAALVYAFGRHKQYINQDAVLEEGGKILMVGYQWLHEGLTKVIVNKEEVRQGIDYSTVQKTLELIQEADAVVAHNGRNFDMKMIQSRALANDLPPVPTVHILDTLEMAKKHFRLPSNKLDSLGATFNLGRKVSHSGIDLWVRVQQGNEEALLEMLEYCKGDVDLLREVFLEMRSRGYVSGFNAANYYDDNEQRCKTCGSLHIEATGRKVSTPTGVFLELKCGDCGSLQRSKTNLSSKDKRKSLTASPKF